MFLKQGLADRGIPTRPLPQGDQHELRAQSRLVLVLVCGGGGGGGFQGFLFKLKKEQPKVQGFLDTRLPPSPPSRVL